MRLAQIRFNPGAHGAGPVGPALLHTLGHARRAIATGAFHRGGQQRVPRREMRVDAPMGQPRLFHAGGHADARLTLAPQRARRGVDDAFVRKRFTGGWARHGRESEI
ncbi:hypothetical protein G6F50_016615 [Rhizopus delemar]|uniref:Uncharacterized protein n=1 Tax=Rhizopus delemar TaxID=936053 RepID=A0A9P7C1Z5_9FUNG|nr:hypothetical protein G6F50_016615 [Rhizopus delemar]